VGCLPHPLCGGKFSVDGNLLWVHLSHGPADEMSQSFVEQGAAFDVVAFLTKLAAEDQPMAGFY
jgi:hypothetical protein